MTRFENLAEPTVELRIVFIVRADKGTFTEEFNPIGNRQVEHDTDCGSDGRALPAVLVNHISRLKHKVGLKGRIHH